MADVGMVVNKGLEITTDRLKGVGGAEPKYLAWGTGSTAVTAADTTLNTETTEESRTSGTSTQETTTTTKDTYQVVGTITCATSAKNIREFGLFDASTVGNMFARVVHDGIAVSIGDSIQYTVKTKYARPA